MTKSEILRVFVAAIIAAVGLILGLFYDGSYFSRSGALLVVAAIIIGLLEVPQRLNKISSWFNKEIESARINAVETLTAEGKDPGKVQEAVNSAIAETRRDLEHEVEKKRKEGKPC